MCFFVIDGEFQWGWCLLLDELQFCINRVEGKNGIILVFSLYRISRGNFVYCFYLNVREEGQYRENWSFFFFMFEVREMEVVYIVVNKKRKVYFWQSSWKVVGEFL